MNEVSTTLDQNNAILTGLGQTENNQTGSSILQEHSNKKRWLSLAVLALAVAIVVIDGTVLNVSQKYVIDDLGTDLKTIQWAFTLYSLVLAALTILGGRLGDLYGRRKMFVLGAFIFALGSLITALSKDAPSLILGWSVVEGVGAALMMPASSALLVSNFEGKERGIAFGIYGAMAGVASSFGPILGGYLASEFSWRFAFGINVVIAGILIVGSRIILDKKEFYPEKTYLDIRGAVLSSLGITAIVYGIIESSTYGWFKAKKAFDFFGTQIHSDFSISLWAILAGIFLLELFVLWEKHVVKNDGDPLIHLDIFKNKGFTFGIGTLSALFAGFSGFITYGVVFFFLVVKGMSSFDAGLALLPFSLGSFFLAPFSVKIGQKIGQRNLVIMGLSINLLGTYMVYKTLSFDAVASDFILGFLVTGIGFGMLAAQLNNIILSSVSQKDAGVASGINGTMREMARAFGVAIIGAAFISNLTTNAVTRLQHESNDTIPSEVKITLIEKLQKESFSLDGEKQKSDNAIIQEAKTKGIPVDIPTVKDEYLQKYHAMQNSIQTDIKKAVTDTSKNTLEYTILFTVIAIFCSFGLEDKTKKNE